MRCLGGKEIPFAMKLENCGGRLVGSGLMHFCTRTFAYEGPAAEFVKTSQLLSGGISAVDSDSMNHLVVDRSFRHAGYAI